ncbi:MAG TPA: peptidase MA family metallohydrolase, partial [Thermomicrobiales bacterium]|nr:peptidase MA family metallohydrolase [Thermomicrobiales bacterium]
TGWLDLQAQYIPPGLVITYQWRLVSSDGVVAVSTEEQTTWFDDRHDWQQSDGRYVSFHWYGLDDDFAADILESADRTVAELGDRFGLTAETRFELWVYPNQTAFSEVLVPNSREALAAATYPDFAITLAVVPDGSAAEIGRVIPHEVAHLVLYEATNSAFSTVPLWFNEGLATHIQVGGTDGYLPMVTRALEDGTLYSLRSIDVTFPFTAYEATLAYAASWSAIAYIEDTWGDAGITSLIAAFAEGHPWDLAVELGLGITMDEFEQGWRDWISEQAPDEAAQGRRTPRAKELPLLQRTGRPRRVAPTERHVNTCTGRRSTYSFAPRPTVTRKARWMLSAGSGWTFSARDSIPTSW